MQKPTDSISFIRRQPRWLVGLVVVLLAAAGWWWWRGGRSTANRAATFVAKRGPLDITVLEGGSLQALESQEIKCEVRVGYQGTKILRIVEEGYLVSEDDVKTNKVLVELDSSEIEKQIVQQEIQYQSALASLTDAQQGYEIQVNQNQSDLAAAEQKVRFARMDFDKFLGDTATDKIVEELGIDRLIAEASTNNVTASPSPDKASSSPRPPPPNAPPDRNAIRILDDRGDAVTVAGPVKIQGTPPGAPPGARPENASLPAMREKEQPTPPKQPTFELPSTAAIDFQKYADIEVLGDGEAKQKLRKNCQSR